MINLNNYETWFMLYADNELSTEECNLVLQFIQENPMLQDEFDSLREAKVQPDEAVMYPDKHLLKEPNLLEVESVIQFEPDLNVFYPNKEELYRIITVKPIWWVRPLQVAAVLVFGLFWFMNRSADDLKTIAGNGSSGVEIKKPIEKKDEVLLPKVNNVFAENHARATPKKYDPMIKKDSPIKIDQSIATTDNNVLVDEHTFTQEVTPIKPISNFTAEAVQAASARIPNEPIPTAVIDAQPTHEVYEEPVKSKKSPFRGLIRKITRTILNENEENDGRNYVHVASFSIPVSKTNNK